MVLSTFGKNGSGGVGGRGSGSGLAINSEIKLQNVIIVIIYFVKIV